MTIITLRHDDTRHEGTNPEWQLARQGTRRMASMILAGCYGHTTSVAKTTGLTCRPRSQRQPLPFAIRIGQLTWDQEQSDHFGVSTDVLPLPNLVHAGRQPLEGVRPNQVGSAGVVQVAQEASGVGVAPATMPSTPLAADAQTDGAVTSDVDGNEKSVMHTPPVIRQLEHRRTRQHRGFRRPEHRLAIACAACAARLVFHPIPHVACTLPRHSAGVLRRRGSETRARRRTRAEAPLRTNGYGN